MHYRIKASNRGRFSNCSSLTGERGMIHMDPGNRIVAETIRSQIDRYAPYSSPRQAEPDPRAAAARAT